MLLLPAICAVLLLPGQAYADETVSAAIPVKIGKTSGSGVPGEVQYTVVLEAITANAPMPDETTITVQDKGQGGEGAFCPITYTLPGDYEYKIYEQNGKQNYFTYDTTVYEVIVRIINDGKGGLASEIGAKKVGGTAKSNIEFNNKYIKPVTPTTSATTSATTSTTRTTIITKYETIAKNDNPAKSNVISSLKGPKTGDDSNPMFWFSILILSWFGIMGVITIRNRRKHSEV